MFKLLFLNVLFVLAIGVQSEDDKIIVTKVEECEIGKTYHTPEGRFTVSSDKMFWNEAVKACNRNNMNLVTVDSQRKNNIIKDLLVTNGYTDKYWTAAFQIYDLWYWTTIGNPVTFSDWVNGQPDEFIENNCIYMEQTGWSDIDCATDLNYVCE